MDRIGCSIRLRKSEIAPWIYSTRSIKLLVNKLKTPYSKDVMRYLKMTVNNDYNFSSRWSHRLATDGFTALPNILIRNQGKLGITDPEMVVLISLASFKWDRQMPYPSVATLSSYSGKSIGAVRNNLRSLSTKGLIKRVYRDNQTSKYDLRPLIKVLESYTQPINKSTHPHQKSDTPARLKIDTKEDSFNNTKERRHRTGGGKLTIIGKLLQERYMP